MKRKSSLIAFLIFALASTAALEALNPDEWRYSQSVSGPTAGTVRFALPASVLDTARPDLGDLRVLDSAGKEVPYFLMRPSSEPARSVAPKDFRAELSDIATTITLETGTTLPLESVNLQTGAVRFLKPVQVELSSDGVIWQTLAEGVPIFRQDGADKTIISLGFRTAAYVRLTLDDGRTRPIVVTGATLRTVEKRSSATEPLSPRIVRTDEFAGETVVTLDLGAKNVALASLEFSAEDSLFARNVVVAVREFKGDQIAERILARGAIFRVALDAFTPTADMRVPVDAAVASRELVVHIQNGDSPPLHIYRITAERRPVHLVVATKSGSTALSLLTGNPQASPPRYDLAGLASELAKLPLATPRIDDPVENPNYHQVDALAGVSLEGAPLDVTPWKFHRSVASNSPGVQEVELDLDVLGNSQDSLSDLRLMQNGKQIPYILERTALVRESAPPAEIAPDPQKPNLSRWKIRLPNSQLPLVKVVLSSPTPLFERQIRLYEMTPDPRGITRPQGLVVEKWIHSPAEKPLPLVLTVPNRLQTDTLWIETDNGDNPEITLENVKVYHPVTRLLYKTATASPVELYYGNEQAGAPRYDLTLITSQLLTAEKNHADLGVPVARASGDGLKLLGSARGGVVFWVVLAAVVVVLLMIVAKLLPKIPSTPEDMK